MDILDTGLRVIGNRIMVEVPRYEDDPERQGKEALEVSLFLHHRLLEDNGLWGLGPDVSGEGSGTDDPGDPGITDGPADGEADSGASEPVRQLLLFEELEEEHEHDLLAGDAEGALGDEAGGVAGEDAGSGTPDGEAGL